MGYQNAMDTFPTYPIRSLRQAGTVLRARRAARKISQKQLGEMTGTAQSTISDIENGVVSVSLDVYLRLLEALGAELSATDRVADPGQH
ncbi:helix-turn-helix transcriptional regulator [Tropicimonas sp. IMCC34043]|uniref:helix-turn-helix domain-containing protein n=1 Tax=Tropicimonas sp. IMCC34043 TaxID=2248760 RepID=UPI001E2971D9|nr:helix-turn-helix transcriptional regulator [Tropicimonas sp. IMCC34043]